MIVECKRGKKTVVVLTKACSRLVLEADALRNSLGRAEVPVGELAKMVVENCSSVVVVGLVDAVDAVAAAAELAVELVAGVQDLEGFAADHQMDHQTLTWLWETEEG